MFIRHKKNKSGIISVQIIDKHSGKYKMIKTIGSSLIDTEISRLHKTAEEWIRNQSGILVLDFQNEVSIFEQFANGIESISVIGTELLLGKLFDEIGFNKISDLIFRKLVIARLCFPVIIFDMNAWL